MSAERWLPVVGYEGLYSVSDQGRVRSEDRMVPHGMGGGLRKIKGSIRVTPPEPRLGYLAISLSRDGIDRHFRVHRLVLEAFCGPPMQGQECCHENGKRDDPRLANLRWDTRRANHHDKWKHGTDRRGTKHPMAKLSVDDILTIRASAELQDVLAARYDVCQSHISSIRRRASWQSV